MTSFEIRLAYQSDTAKLPVNPVKQSLNADEYFDSKDLEYILYLEEKLIHLHNILLEITKLIRETT